MAAPPHPVSWPVSWQRRRAWGSSRRRTCRYTQLRGRWAGSGPQSPVPVFVVEVAGYGAPCFLVTSALDRSAARVAAAWTARFRQAAGFRDHKRRLGMEACRAWTKTPILRPFQVQLVALTLLRLLQVHVERPWGAGQWWRKPKWDPRKRHASLLDRRRLCWRHRPEFSQVLVVLEETGKIPQPLSVRQALTGRAA
jgi:hypothetical protein